MAKTKDNTFKTWFEAVWTLEEGLLNPLTAAKLLGMHDSNIHLFVKRGWLSYYRHEKQVWVSYKDVKKIEKYYALRNMMSKSKNKNLFECPTEDSLKKKDL